MIIPNIKCSLTKVALVAVCVALICIALAGTALAEILSTDTDSAMTPPVVTIEETDSANDADVAAMPALPETVTADPEVAEQSDVYTEDPEPRAIAPLPARYGGTVKYANGDLVDWDEIAGYIDLDSSGAIESGEIPNPDHNVLLKNNSGTYTIGQYGLPLTDHIGVKQLLVNCPEDTACSNKPVLFRVKVGGVTYNATTNPTTVRWLSNQTANVNLTISSTPVTGIKGYVYLDTAYDNSGTMVKVKQGSSTIATKFTDINGKYEMTGLSAGAYTLEFSNTSASWKKVTRSATVGTSGFTTIDVTMYLGDVNQDAAINFSDLLWLSRRIGSIPGQSLWDDLGDINNDNIINILDLLTVNQNIGR